jgi:Domain of unknown function (DUF4266)
MRAWVRIVCAVTAAAIAAGCATVRPHQRERLAAPALAEPAWPAIEPHDQHVRDVREGTGGATGATGGGCGCN